MNSPTPVFIPKALRDLTRQPGATSVPRHIQLAARAKRAAEIHPPLKSGGTYEQ
jgi:hypothetical protein